MKLWRQLREHLQLRKFAPAILDPGRQARQLLAQAVRLAADSAPDPRLAARAALPGPLISLVAPVYNTKASYLDALLRSFESQIIPGRTTDLFELVLSDDGSKAAETRRWLDRHQHHPAVRLVRNADNRGIAAATNAGITAARGDWIGLIDHDDAIAPYALERIARVLIDRPEALFLYTDEVVADAALNPVGVFLKPAWDEVLLSGVNYVNHFSVYRRARLIEIGLIREGFEGSQDYDLVLRYTQGLSSDEILHLPYPAYLWRRDGVSYSARHIEKATAHARKALAGRFGGSERPMPVLPALEPNLHRLDFAATRETWPLVSVIIPSRDSPGLIRQVMQGLAERTDYPAMEIIVVDNGSEDREVLALYRQWERGPLSFRAIVSPEAFNFSRAVNRGIAAARGDAMLLLNNDIEMRERGWLKEMVSCLGFQQTGVVGAKLLYPDGQIQHAGVIAGLGGLAGHWFIGQPGDFVGPMGRLRVRQSLSVVTGACLLITRECWERTGPFDETEFAIAYNDVDFCLRAVDCGFRVIWTPFAELIHHESASRGSDEAPDKIDRFRREQANLRARHRTDKRVDPAFNPWWGRQHSVPEFVQLDRLPDAR